MPTICSGTIHIVQPGETLLTISRIHGISLDKIISANPEISDPDNLQIFQEICIPSLPLTELTSTRESLSYLYGGNTQYYLDLIFSTQNSLKTICPDSFEISETGNLLVASLDKLNSNFIEAVHEQGIKITPFVTNNWNRTTGFLALDNRENLSGQIAETVLQYNVDGVNIDIENVTEEYREQYIDFIRMLRQKLFQNKIISVAVAANPNGWTMGWHGSYDYKALSDYCDYLLIMAYDESYQGSAEGPISSSEFFNRSIQYALNQGVQKEKIVVGIPFFGRYWKLGEEFGGIGLADIDVKNLLKNYKSTSRFDEATQSAYAEVIINPDEPEPDIWGGRRLTAGTYHIWYDNEEATRYKLNQINEYNVKGVGSWALGQEIPDIWNFYTSVLNGEKSSNSSKGNDIDMTQQETFNFIYPVGSLYMSVNDSNPSDLFGGTWIRWGNGRTILGVDENDPQGYFNTSEVMGGERIHRHAFRIGMHWWFGAAAGENATNGTGAYRYSDGQYDGWNRPLANKELKINSANYNSLSSNIGNPNGQWSLGDTDTAENWPPYITCYIWKRIE